MLPLVETPVHKLKDYKAIIPKSLYQEIRSLAKRTKGLKIAMINSTPRGGGVAEMLKSLVPLMKDLGLNVEWYTIPAIGNIFDITKQIHNALQGKEYRFFSSDKKKYLDYMKKIAKLIDKKDFDIWMVHDPQPIALASFVSGFSPALCRFHIDLSSPNKEVWSFVSQFLKDYEKIILSSKEYIENEIKDKAVVFPPGIDPLVPKNHLIPKKSAREILESVDISPDKPLVSQVFRFDYFKDPLGSLETYKIAKKKIPSLQLALVGFFLASDDPEAVEVYKKTKERVGNDPDVFLFVDANKLSGLKVDTFVNAVQNGSDVILQKSVKEGFGLTVTEAMWKKKAVVGGNVGGIKLQIEDGKNGFLVNNSQEAAQRIIELLKNPSLAEKIGRAGRETVRRKFLTPRVLRDYLKLFEEFI